MKNTPWLILALLAFSQAGCLRFVAGPSPCSWKTLNLPATQASSASSMAVGSSGEVYVVGIFDPGKDDSSIFLIRSMDEGATWSSPMTFPLAQGQPADPANIWTSPNGGVFVSITGIDSSTHPGAINYAHKLRWLTFQSTDKGASFKKIDDFQSNEARTTPKVGISPVGDAAIIAGYVEEPVMHWLVRSWSSGGPWTTLEPAPGGAPLQNGIALGATFDSQKTVYVVGYVRSGPDIAYARWLVRALRAGAWRTIDDFQPAKQTKAAASAAYAAGVGNLYVAGFAEDAHGRGHWIVRMSDSNGGNWKTVDDYVSPDSNTISPISINAGPSGVLYVAGADGAAKERNHWLVRRSADGGKTWSLVDRFSGVEGDSCSATSIKVARSGTVFVSGLCVDAGGLSRVTVRQGRCD